jgi:hypothetical protein
MARTAGNQHDALVGGARRVRCDGESGEDDDASGAAEES